MPELTMMIDAQVYLEVDPETREVRTVRILPAQGEGSLHVYDTELDDNTAESIRLEVASKNWRPLMGLPVDVIWEG